MTRRRIAPPTVVPSTLLDACRRVGMILATTKTPTIRVKLPRGHTVNDQPHVELLRADLVALVAACGWVVPLESSVDPEPLADHPTLL